MLLTFYTHAKCRNIHWINTYTRISMCVHMLCVCVFCTNIAAFITFGASGQRELFIGRCFNSLSKSIFRPYLAGVGLKFRCRAFKSRSDFVYLLPPGCKSFPTPAKAMRYVHKNWQGEGENMYLHFGNKYCCPNPLKKLPHNYKNLMLHCKHLQDGEKNFPRNKNKRNNNNKEEVSGSKNHVAVKNISFPLSFWNEMWNETHFL